MLDGLLLLALGVVLVLPLPGEFLDLEVSFDRGFFFQNLCMFCMGHLYHKPTFYSIVEMFEQERIF